MFHQFMDMQATGQMMSLPVPALAQQMGSQHMDGHDKKGKGKGRQKRPQANSAKAAKRASFPVINQELVAAAQTGDLNELVSTVENYLPKMNLVNLTTALHRLAKLTANDPSSQHLLHQHRVLGGIVAGVHAALARSEAGGAIPQCQVLSNVPWALATLSWVDMPLLVKMASLAEKRVEEFKTFELSPLLWAYAKLESTHGEAGAAQLFRLAASRVQRSASDFSFRCLVMIAWAFATAGLHDRDVFMAIAPHMRASAHVAQHQELANTVWSFSTAHVQHEELFAEIAQRALQHLWDFKGQDFTNLICGFATSDFYSDALYANAVRVAEYLELEPAQLLRITWSIAPMCSQHSALQGVVQSLLHRCSTVLSSFAAHELGQLAIAAAASLPPYRGLASGSVAGAAEVSHFLEQVQPVLADQLTKLPLQLLAYDCAAYVKGASAESRIAFLDRAAAVIMWRLSTSSPSSQLLFLRCLPTETAQCKQLVQTLFANFASNAARLSSKELQQLSLCAAASSEWPNDVTDVEAIQHRCQALSAGADIKLRTVLSNLDEVLEEIFSHAQPTGMAEKRVSPKASPEGNSGTDERSAGSAAMPGVQEGLRYTVKNTFVELETDEGRMFEDDECGIPLPPSLEIIPDSIPPEMLEEYRRNYQKFRAGKPTGAKGELSLITAEVFDDEESYMTEALDLAVSWQEQQDAKERSRQAGALASTADAPRQKMEAHTWMTADGASNGSSTPLTGQPTRLPPGLPPPLDCVPRFIDPEKLASFRMGYQQFRMGLGMGAKGEAARATVASVGPRSIDLTLPPPLSIIPQEIPAERLETYRQSYQRFRIGQAVGAKGEVSSLSFDSLLPESSASSRSRPQAEQQEQQGETLDPLTSQAWNVKTKNTFLHIDNQSEVELDADGRNISLTEPLECVSRDISPTELNAYRLDYQSFRAGKAIGAKGELGQCLQREDSESKQKV